jgi:hypothetical protein
MQRCIVYPRTTSSGLCIPGSRTASRLSTPREEFARWALLTLIASILFGCGGGDSATVIAGSGTSAAGTAGSTAVPAVTATSAGATVAADNGMVPGNLFSAILAGTREVPAVASNGSGVGVVLIDSSARVLKASITTTGIAGSAASIQQAVSGGTGPVVFPMGETPVGSGVWTVQATVTTEQLATMIAGGYYFNVASPTRPAGEIRGQILRQLPISSTGGAATTSTGSSAAGVTPTTFGGATVFVNVLSPAQQVPASSSTAMGVGVAVVSRVAPTLTASVITAGMVGSSAAISSAAPGSIGPNVASLFETAAGSGIWTVRTNLTTAQSATLTSGGDYFEVRSAAFPNGEIRGQIVSPAQAAAFGTSASAINTANQGTAGAAGTGITGPTGVTGITGTTAITANPGITGSTATPGLTGTNAITGTSGLTGFNAITGSPGVSGTGLTPGVLTGTTTPAGPAGTSGFTTVPATSVPGISSSTITRFGTIGIAIPIAAPSPNMPGLGSTGIAGSAGATGISTTGTPGSAGATGIGTGSVPTLTP